MFAYDQSAYKHKDLLYLFAAGNDYSYFSINSPSCTKNVVSIGATNSVSKSTAETSTYSVVIQNETVSFKAVERSSGTIRKLGISPKMKYLTNLSVVMYESANASSDIDLRDKIVLLDFVNEVDSSDFCNAYSDSVSKGAKVVVYRSSIFFRCGSTPITTLHTNDENLGKISTMKKASIFPFDGSEGELPTIAGLSLKGPSDTALTKPDIAVPGSHVTSAKSHGVYSSYSPNADFSDNLVQMSGTSMATPGLLSFRPTLFPIVIPLNSLVVSEISVRFS